RRRHTRFSRDWSSDVCSSDLSDYKLLSSEITSEEVLNYRTNFVESMKELINEIEQINNSHIINSAIDKTMLFEVAEVASNKFIEIGRASCREGGEMSVDEHSV